MGKVTSEILTSFKLRHLTPTCRWVWVVLNLLGTDLEHRVCNPQGQAYSISELAAFSMIEEQTFRTCISQLVNVGMAAAAADAVRLLWDCDEERKHRKRLKARIRKAKQRSREKTGRDESVQQTKI